MATPIFDRNAFAGSLAPLIEALKVLGAAKFPMTQYATRKAAYHIADFWVQCAQGNPIPGTDRTIRDDEYARSIEAQQLGDFRWVIGSHDKDKHAHIVDGSDERDMKKGLPGYKKSKHNKKGEPYLIVPFKHSTEQLKSAKRTQLSTGKERSMYDLASVMQKSRVTSHDKISGQRTYEWAKPNHLLKFAEVKAKPHHKRDIFAGIVRFDTSTGMASRSAYMTFRTISVHSDPLAWIIPPKPGIPITDLVYDATKQDVVEMVERGVADDFRTIGVVK